MQTFSLLKRAWQIAVLALCYCLFSGCSSQDDLNVKNEFDFPIVVKMHGDISEKTCAIKIVAKVSAHTTVLFSRYGGLDINEFWVENEQGTQLEKLKPTGENVTQKSVGCAGKTVWNITVAPKLPANVAVAQTSP